MYLYIEHITMANRIGIKMLIGLRIYTLHHKQPAYEEKVPFHDI